jgi:hypothetical protein
MAPRFCVPGAESLVPTLDYPEFDPRLD